MSLEVELSGKPIYLMFLSVLCTDCFSHISYVVFREFSFFFRTRDVQDKKSI